MATQVKLKWDWLSFDPDRLWDVMDDEPEQEKLTISPSHDFSRVNVPYDIVMPVDPVYFCMSEFLHEGHNWREIAIVAHGQRITDSKFLARVAYDKDKRGLWSARVVECIIIPRWADAAEVLSAGKLKEPA